MMTARSLRSAERMADYKVPDRLRIRSKPLPRNANGKLQKDELRREIPDLARPHS